MTRSWTTIDKLRGLPEAVAWRNSLRGTVVFTNGVFDIVHGGHVRVIETAKAEGDWLIVGVNDDESVRQLVREGRRPPVNTGTDRARVIAALAATDCVVPFSEATPRELIGALRPDVLVKGADYENQYVPGADEVRAGGGRVVFVPLQPGYSTTEIMGRIHAAG